MKEMENGAGPEATAPSSSSSRSNSDPIAKMGVEEHFLAGQECITEAEQMYRAGHPAKASAAAQIALAHFAASEAARPQVIRFKQGGRR